MAHGLETISSIPYIHQIYTIYIYHILMAPYTYTLYIYIYMYIYTPYIPYILYIPYIPSTNGWHFINQRATAFSAHGCPHWVHCLPRPFNIFAVERFPTNTMMWPQFPPTCRGGVRGVRCPNVRTRLVTVSWLRGPQKTRTHLGLC